jgi:hypothetical protein
MMFTEGGELKSYMYYPDMHGTASGCGESWQYNHKVAAGSWHQIKMYVRANSGGTLKPGCCLGMPHAGDVLWSGG